MENNFLTRKADYIFDFVNNDEIVDHTTDIFRFPNITAKQLGEIMISPDNEAELKFANAVLELSKTIEQNIDITITDIHFDPLNNSGYDYYEFGALYFLDAIKELDKKYFLHDEKNKPLYFAELENYVLDVANDARNRSVDEYHQICCDVNMLGSLCYTITLIKTLLTKDEVIEFQKYNSFPTYLLLASSFDYLGQALFIGDKDDKEGSKNTLTEKDLELATQFTYRFNAYIQSLRSFARN